MIKLRGVLFRRRLCLFDGENVYWSERDSERIRWALAHKEDDGLGYRTHGAANSLLLAVEDAYRAGLERKDAIRAQIT